jgi:hypothetical protein
MSSPADEILHFTTTPKHIQLNRMVITDITITQDSPIILYQVPFELTNTPSRVWKEVLMDSWQSTIQHKGRILESVIWIFHNRILIDNIPIEFVKDEIETLVAIAIDKTNNKIKLRKKIAI